jgi:Predicted integral membrane zinc-ribbon metal-binding protein
MYLYIPAENPENRKSLLHQRYDLDPAEKAAAAAVLASKLSADSGLKLSMGDEPNSLSSPKVNQRRSVGPLLDAIEESSNEFGESDDIEETNQKSLEKYKVPGGNSEGWLAQIAALLVGEHPSQCYALICCKCHMHNGMFNVFLPLIFVAPLQFHLRLFNQSVFPPIMPLLLPDVCSKLVFQVLLSCKNSDKFDIVCYLIYLRI